MENKLKKMPHNGDLLEKYIDSSGISRSAISREMGYSRSLIQRLFNTPSIRTHIWWGLGIAINRNIFAELGELFPVKHKTKRELELEEELEMVKKELEVYRRIHDRKS